MVTVIIPNYNHVSFLEQRITSVLNQTFEFFEVIILDDSSTDDSRKIIEKYKNHPRVSQIVYNTYNSGSVFKQWEKGINLAKGDFIWIAESDDYAHQHFLERMVPLLLEDSDLGFVYCDTYIVRVDGTLDDETFAGKRNASLRTSKWSKNYILEGKKEIKENLLEYCTVNNASGVLFRKSALAQVNPFDRSFRYIGDWYCYVKVCNKYKIAYLNETLNYYREHGINTSTSLYQNLNYVGEYFIFYDWALKHLTYINRKLILSFFIRYVNHSISRNWSLGKLKLYRKLFRLNPLLFLFLIKNNLLLTFKRPTLN